MIGVFDSGDGGLLTVEKIREISPMADICFFADRENAPYGTKTRSEIISLSKKNIRLLRNAGADNILIACCTASSVYPYLSRDERRIAVPIIDATARVAARKTRTGKIGVIATRLTEESGAFEKSILKYLPTAQVVCREAQELVGLIEGGANDLSVSREDFKKVERSLSKIIKEDFDILILGCTHFPRLEKTIGSIVGCETVSSAQVGAAEMIDRVGYGGDGKSIFL